MAKAASSKSDANPATQEANETSELPRAQPTEEEIAVRAYHIYLDRGEADGNSSDDWLQAERELTEGLNTSAAE